MLDASGAPCATSGAANEWFAAPGSEAAERAKALCAGCPLRAACADLALSEGIPEGIWGGIGPDERRDYWRANGGRPTAFDEAIDALTRPFFVSAYSTGEDET